MAEFIAFLLMLFLYFIPALVGKNKRNAGSIFLLNLLAGWTIIGWIGALIWAASKDPQPATVVVTQAAPTPVPVARVPVASSLRPSAAEETARPLMPARPVEPAPRQMEMAVVAEPVAKPVMPTLSEELERLFQLKEKGALTEEEYTVQKTKLLA
jgi:hypothetical protein